MTDEQAQRAANILMGAAALGAAYFILRDPSRRRMAWQLARNAVATTGPVLMLEARRAWSESGSGSPRPETGDMMSA